MVSMCVCVLFWDSGVGVCICFAVWRWGGGCNGGAGGVIVMHLDGFRDSSFEKQGPH